VIFPLAECYFNAGFNTLEVTMNTKGALDIIARLGRDYPDRNIGAGTVCTRDDLDQAIGAGARFIVTPTLDEEIIERAVAQNVPIFPGAYTPSEIHKAWKLGASAVKVFPATQLGPQYIKDVLAPLNQIKLLPTGGVSLENIKSFFQAGAVGVGMGSSLFNKKMIKERDYQGLKKHFLSIKKAVKEFVKICR
jgi:2-dehydro-3-deoxyphosphogluconate aldolase/(4S)-4-hydroxy-2-oxoglutarate aldolase